MCQKISTYHSYDMSRSKMRRKKTVTVMTLIIKSMYLSKSKQEISLSTFIKNIDFNSGFFLHKYFDKGYIKIIVFHSKLNKVKKTLLYIKSLFGEEMALCFRFVTRNKILQDKQSTIYTGFISNTSIITK